MSRLLDEMTARYGGARGTSAPRKAKASPPAVAGPARRTPGRSPGSPPPSPSRGRRRPVEGLEWADVDGVGVLRLAGTVSDYEAFPSVDRPGTYDIRRLHSRAIVWYGARVKDVLHRIQVLIHQDAVDAVRRGREVAEGKEVEARRRQVEEEAREDEETRRHGLPGFYITPGEFIEDARPVPIGPFWRFGSAGIRPDREDSYRRDDIGDHDVEEYAIDHLIAVRKEGERRLMPVRIIECSSLHDASRGRGHVWWQDGVLRGPPVAPGQAGWGW